jgi:DNA polymerase elongation subunit (family B)
MLKEVIEKIKNREVKKEDLIVRTQLKKPISEYVAISPHVIAAKKMKEREIPVAQGDLIEYYLAETNTKSKLVRDKVKLPDETAPYDITYYLEKQILPAVENIFQVFNINLKDMIEGKKQENLSKWF